MIYYQLKGGLGNMLFGIAASLSIAKNNNTDAIFSDINIHLENLNNDTVHNPKLNYALEYKNLNIFKNLNYSKIPDVIKKCNFPFYYQEIKLEETDILINGFFQSEKYFINNEQYIRDIFSIDNYVLNKINEKYNNILKDNNNTSIHVRRGDYLKFSNYHPTPSLEYFKNAINLTKHNTDKYIIFSDDIEWCKTKFEGNKFIFIENEKDYIELYMMSLCKNNIISNSSFSWWGAWLNLNKDKVIISPKQWFGDLINETDKDIIPENWKRI